ncbi:hypothetical protein OCK74_05870 [Chitinophagaceae bacterium LB-8]|uniref:Uncharacterized protein n=1 Tax=Paraflavisolibacter caeni TaxID=2982496 RepID=A0A9X3BFE3_9BACT|nr:hypothetical protein [Paraflavisolibacter caeni]MCU7548634.1 hypothetical protein [Paraflavisolibacter caeni]
MKPLTLLTMPLLAVVIFCVISCGGQGGNKNETTTTEDTTTTTTTTTEATTPASTITTMPQDMVVATHKVADFNKWEASYDAHDSMRLANGVHSYVIGRNIKDTNMVMVATKVDDMKKAKAFAKDPALKQAMQKGGVMGTPHFNFITMVYQDTSKIESDLRSRTTFMVKDWDRWQKKFDSGRQMRKDNGIVDRAYGHDVDDNHKVVVVVALTDTAKAFAHWKSDDIKKGMEAAGVIGQPERFLFRIVKRY